MANRTLNSPFETSGEWFLPTEPGRILAGRLRYDSTGAELHLDEAIVPLRGTINFGDETRTYPAIYGTTSEGEKVTIFRVQSISTSMHFVPGDFRQSEILKSSLLLIGAHLPFDYAYPEMSFRIPGLQIWLAQPVIEHIQERDQATTRPTISYRVRGLVEEDIRVPSINCTLSWWYSSHSNLDQFSSIELKVSGWITIRPDTPQGIEWYFEQLTILTTMLSFMAGTNMSPDCIQTPIGATNNKADVLAAFGDTKVCSYSNLSEFYMPRTAMGMNLSDVISRWFDVYSKVKTPSKLFISILASDKIWLHVEFLSLIQALEGFHRGLFNGDYMPETDYTPIRQTICGAIPATISADHKEALKSRVKWGYQYSLQKRLNELAECLSVPIRQQVLGEDGRIPRPWIDTRNYYTHWDENSRGNVLEEQNAYFANVRMSHFLRALYLDRMGITQEAILAAINRHSEIARRLQYANTVSRRQHAPDDRTGLIMRVSEHHAEVTAESGTSAVD